VTVRPGDNFTFLVAKLAREPQCERSAVPTGSFIAIHSIGEKVCGCNASPYRCFPTIRINRVVDKVSGLRQDPDEFQHVRERHPIIRDIRPAFFTLQHRDMAARRVTLS